MFYAEDVNDTYIPSFFIRRPYVEETIHAKSLLRLYTINPQRRYVQFYSIYSVYRDQMYMAPPLVKFKESLLHSADGRRQRNFSDQSNAAPWYVERPSAYHQYGCCCGFGWVGGCCIAINIVWSLLFALLFSAAAYARFNPYTMTILGIDMEKISQIDFDTLATVDLDVLISRLNDHSHPEPGTPAIAWLLRQFGEEDNLDNHPPDDDWWSTREKEPTTIPTAPGNPAIEWIMRQFGEEENLLNHPIDDEWWSTHPKNALTVPADISPAVHWLLLKMGQENELLVHSVFDHWWTKRPQTPITINASLVEINPLPSVFGDPLDFESTDPFGNDGVLMDETGNFGRRRLGGIEEGGDDDTPVRLQVNGKMRVRQSIEYYSIPKSGYVKLMVAPESLKYMLGIFNLNERPWSDEAYWSMRDRGADIIINNTVHMDLLNVKKVIADEAVVDGPLSTYGMVDFWPAEQTYSGRLRSPHLALHSCHRCKAFVDRSSCAHVCAPHFQIARGRFGFSNHSCSCT